jgi:hypothetical protein
MTSTNIVTKVATGIAAIETANGKIPVYAFNNSRQCACHVYNILEMLEIESNVLAPVDFWRTILHEGFGFVNQEESLL